jgi:hypothetical protein
MNDQLNAVPTFMVALIEKLFSNQEPLGHEFEQVLFENLWDLYQN